MIDRRQRIVVFCIVLSIAAPRILFGAGGTSIVATKGRPTHVSAGWPEGVGELVNDPARTSGWNSWFTEWPNDVRQYAFEIKSTDDLNRLIAKLAAIKSELRQIRLSHLKEPSGLGWVTQVPEGNGIPVIFSIGDQARIDEWYKHVRKPFGVMEFTAAPVAVPPTLTIFVQNESVNLDELEIQTASLCQSATSQPCFTNPIRRSNDNGKKRPRMAKRIVNWRRSNRRSTLLSGSNEQD